MQPLDSSSIRSISRVATTRSPRISPLSITGNLEDFYKQHFLGLIHNYALGGGNLKTDLRYFYSTSDGKNSSESGRAEGYRSNGYWTVGDSKRGWRRQPYLECLVHLQP